MHENFYRILKPTKISNTEIKNVIKYKDGINITSKSVPRYEYFRGVEGEYVVDFTDYIGIEDLGDKIKVKGGTRWRDVIKYNVELWSNLDFSVAGSVYFNDPIFGFNEFGEIRDKVEVDAISNQNPYFGKYNGGIIINVYIRKETKEIAHKVKYDTKLENLFDIVKKWYVGRIPPFRDVSIIKKDEEIYLSVSYPKIREGLVKNFVNDFNDDNKIEYDSLTYKFWYFGYLDFNKLDEIIGKTYESRFSIIRFRKNRVAYSIYSDKPIVGLENSLDYSTLENENLFKGCILCGNCISVCPYGKQSNDSFYTPLGFYSFSYFNQVGDIANCHLCGLCEEVCPMKLDITLELRKNSNLKEINPNYTISVIKPKSSVLVITPISEGFYDLIVKSIIYLVRKGKKIGIIYLPYNFSKIVKNEIDLKGLEGVKEIYVISPEEYFYLKRLLAKNIVDIYNIQALILEELNIDINDVHVPCLLRSDVKANKITCSNVFLNLLNGKDNINKEIKNKITLCPLTGRELGIPTPLDVLNYNIDFSIANKILDKIKQSINDLGEVVEDINWYSGLDNMIYENLYSSIVNNIIKNESLENLIIFFFFTQKLDNIDENLKKTIVSEIDKIIFS